MNYFVSALIQFRAGLTNPLVVQQYKHKQIHVQRQQKFWSKYSTASSTEVQFYQECTCVMQSQKNPINVSALLTGKFLQIRKVFATISLLAEEFPDTLQYKISR